MSWPATGSGPPAPAPDKAPRGPRLSTGSGLDVNHLGQLAQRTDEPPACSSGDLLNADTRQSQVAGTLPTHRLGARKVLDSRRGGRQSARRAECELLNNNLRGSLPYFDVPDAAANRLPEDGVLTVDGSSIPITEDHRPPSGRACQSMAAATSCLVLTPTDK
jgi:hypothetical protein